MVRDLWPLAPALGLIGYFVAALALFAVKRGRQPFEGEVADRPASRLLGRWIRQYMLWLLGPFERALGRLGVPPNAITLFALALSLGSAAALGSGWFGLGGWLYLAAGMCDILDGRVARASGRVSPGGAFFDSVVDRYAELAVFSGLAVYYRGSWALGVVLVAGAGSFMVSYARARGEGLGVDVRVGTMQRPERLFYLGVVVAYSPLWEALWHRGAPVAKPLYAPALVALALLGLSANVTAVRRIVHTLRSLDGRPPTTHGRAIS